MRATLNLYLCRLAGLSLLAMMLIPACAQDVGLIDRTQPGLIQKGVFEGDWFMRSTVIEVPYDADYTFVGEQDEVVRIRWDLQEKHLVALRVTPQVEGTPDAAPVAVFAIDGHVDVIRQYNEATGEQSNVLEENTTDRMWFDRGWVRVDWSKNLVTNFAFFSTLYLEQEPVAYAVTDRADEDRLLLGRLDEDGQWIDEQDPTAQRDLEDAQYIDVVSRTFVTPETVYYEDDWGDLYLEPACWWYGNYDCVAAIVSIRNSFLRVDAAVSGDFEPLDYPDNAVARDEDGRAITVHWTATGDLEQVEASTGEAGSGDRASGAGPLDPYGGTSDQVRLPFFDKFGYFRVERHGYDPRYGELESERTYLINRWNIWERSTDDEGHPLPYAERGYRPVVYYLSPDFPEHLEIAAQQVADQWSEALRETVSTLTGDPDPPAMFVLRHNSRVVDPDTGEVLVRGEVNGDLRYSHIWLVDVPSRVGLLGYGPSAVDPMTGEIFQADAYVYNTGCLEYAAEGRDIVDLINGRLSPADVAMGENIHTYLATLSEGGAQPEARSLEEVREFAHAHPGPSRPEPKGTPKEVPGHQAGAFKSPVDFPGAEKLKRPAGWADARLGAIEGTPYEDLLMGHEDIRSLKAMGLVDPSGTVGIMSPGLADRISPVRWGSRAHRQETLERFRHFAKRNMLMKAFTDDAVSGLALQLAEDDPEDVFEAIHTLVFRATTEHEVGHTVGLRHNFDGSADAMNYHPEYWTLRGDDPQPLVPNTEAQRDGRMKEYQYSSIMDYASRFNADSVGIGRYDVAAIKFGYGQLVEVFETPPVDPLLNLRDHGDGTYSRAMDLAGALKEFRHYTRIPSILGGVDNIGARRNVPFTPEVAALMPDGDTPSLAAQLTGDAPWTLWEVPYKYCSDEYTFGTETCYPFDQGADTWEIVTDAAARWENYYWFNNFKRDRVFFDQWDYMDSVFWRYFAFILNGYHHWVFDQWFTAWDWDDMRDSDAVGYGIEDVPWTEALDGGAAKTAAVMDGLRFLWRVVGVPEPGAYWYDFWEGYYWAFSSAPAELCPTGWSWDYDWWCADMNVGLGLGRHPYTIYDAESGYYFYERVKWIGSFYDKLTALDVMTSPWTWFMGVDTNQDEDEWAMSMYLYFPKEMQQLFAGLAADRFDLFAYVATEEGTLVPRDPFATGEEKVFMETAKTVDPQTSFTMQLYALWYGMGWFNANYDNTFNDSAKIWLKGSGEAIDVIDSSLLIEFEDPFNNRIYVASRPSDETVIGVGWAMLNRAQYWKDQWAAAVADPTSTPSDIEDYKWQVTNVIENVEVVRGLYDIYGYLYF